MRQCLSRSEAGVRKKLHLVIVLGTVFISIYYFLTKHAETNLGESSEYAQIIATGGINNQIISAANALLLAQQANITVLLPFFSFQTKSRSKYSPTSFDAYFDVSHFAQELKKMGLSVSLVPPPNCEKYVLPKSSGRKFKDIVGDMKRLLIGKSKCKLLEIENQWGIRDWEGGFNKYMEVFEAFKISPDLYEIYDRYKKKFLGHPYIALHARVEKSWPTIYFNPHAEDGVRDEIAGMMLHLKKIDLKSVQNIFILSGRNCQDDIFFPLRAAGFNLLCLDSRSSLFNNTGDVAQESYQKALVDSLIALDAEHFIGRYASSASYMLRIKMKARNVSMYCASSGYMCSDCGRNCLKHRGIKRHYKSIRDMENCFFMPGCGTEMCVDRVSTGGIYACQKVSLRKKSLYTSSDSCRRIQYQLIQQNSFKFWYGLCKKGKNECDAALLRNC